MQAPVSVATSTRCVAPSCLRVPQAVAENEAAFRVGVVDFDGQPGRAAVNIAGLDRRAARHVLRARNDAMMRSGTRSSAIARSAAMTVAPPAMSSFIRSMPSAGLMREAAGVERDALPDQAEHRTRPAPRRLVARDQHARRFRAAARDAEEQAHAELFHLLLVEHIAGDIGQRQQRLARATKSRGVSRLPGSLISTRAALMASPTRVPRSTRAGDVARGRRLRTVRRRRSRPSCGSCSGRCRSWPSVSALGQRLETASCPIGRPR